MEVHRVRQIKLNDSSVGDNANLFIMCAHAQASAARTEVRRWPSPRPAESDPINLSEDRGTSSAIAAFSAGSDHVGFNLFACVPSSKACNVPSFLKSWPLRGVEAHTSRFQGRGPYSQAVWH